MSEEFKTEEKQECFCKSKGFRKFLTIALGTFVGVYAALCLFTALHRPPIIPPCRYGFYPPAPVAAPCHTKMYGHHFKRNSEAEHGDFHKAVKENKGQAPFVKDREIDD